jgi:hypothetical protein
MVLPLFWLKNCKRIWKKPVMALSYLLWVLMISMRTDRYPNKSLECWWNPWELTATPIKVWSVTGMPLRPVWRCQIVCCCDASGIPLGWCCIVRRREVFSKTQLHLANNGVWHILLCVRRSVRCLMYLQNSHDRNACEAILKRENQGYLLHSYPIALKMSAEPPDDSPALCDHSVLSNEANVLGQQANNFGFLTDVDDRDVRDRTVSVLTYHSAEEQPDNYAVNVNYSTSPSARVRSALQVSPSPHYLCAPPQQARSYTSVNLTLRPPSSEPQPPIDIRSAGSSLTYSTCSYDPRQGFQSQLQICIGPGGVGSVSALRTHTPSVRTAYTPAAHEGGQGEQLQSFTHGESPLAWHGPHSSSSVPVALCFLSWGGFMCRHKQQDDLTSLLLIFQNKGTRAETDCCRMLTCMYSWYTFVVCLYRNYLHTEGSWAL